MEDRESINPPDGESSVDGELSVSTVWGESCRDGELSVLAFFLETDFFLGTDISLEADFFLVAALFFTDSFLSSSFFKIFTGYNYLTKEFLSPVLRVFHFLGKSHKTASFATHFAPKNL